MNLRLLFRHLAAQVLYKLTPDSQHRGGRFTPYRYRRGTKPIANAPQKPAGKLLRGGYTVNNSTPIYSLYGIGLDAHRADRPDGYRGVNGRAMEKPRDGLSTIRL